MAWLPRGQGLCHPARAAPSSPPSSEPSAHGRKRKRIGQLSGRRVYSPKSPLHPAAV